MAGVLLSGGWLRGLSRARGRGQDSFWRSLGGGTGPCCSSLTAVAASLRKSGDQGGRSV